MKDKFNNEEIEDIEFLFSEIQSSFNIEFTSEETKMVRRFDDLVSLVINKIEGTEDLYCITQLTFYKVRTELSKILNIEKSNLKPSTIISDIIPINRRIEIKNKLDTNLKHNTGLLIPPLWIRILLSIFLLIGLSFLFFIKFKIGIIITGISIGLFILAYNFALNLTDNTLRDLTIRLSKFNYYYFKPNDKKNIKEIKTLVYNWTTETLGWDKDDLNEKTRFK